MHSKNFPARTALFFCAIGLAILTGCSHEQTPPQPPTSSKASKPVVAPAVSGQPAPEAAAPAPPPPDAAGTAATQPAPGDPAASTTPAGVSEFASPQVEGDVNIGSLQEAVGSFTRATKRQPKSLQDLVTAHFITAIPPAPKGKRYVLDAASQTVKTVNE